MIKIKLLIYSVIAVAILIGVSFTSVVGYRSVASDVKASPLFNIRSSRAIEEESGDLSCDYVGKGDEITIPLPTRDNRTELMQMIIDIVRMMDDKTYIKFVNLLFDKGFNNILIDGFYHARNNPKSQKNDLIDRKQMEPLWTKGECSYYTGFCCITSDLLLCIELIILLFIWWIQKSICALFKLPTSIEW